MQFNVNDTVHIKLTDVGKQILKDRYDEDIKQYPHQSPFRPIDEDSNGFSRWQLWQVMQAFGEHIYSQCDLPFEIVIKIPDQFLRSEENGL